MSGGREEISSNLAREWVAEQIQSLRTVHATITSRWAWQGPSWPEGEEPQEGVEVYVEVPDAFNEANVDSLVESLTEAAESDLRFGHRFDWAWIGDFRKNRDIELVENDEGAVVARILTLHVSVKGPDLEAKGDVDGEPKQLAKPS